MLKNKSPPYGNTSINASTTVHEINSLLLSAGAKDIYWIFPPKDGVVQLSFTAISANNKQFTIQLTPKPIVMTKNVWDTSEGCNRKVTVRNWKQTLRLMYWFLKSKIEAIEYGLVTVEQEFLGDILLSLPSYDGNHLESKTVGEIKRCSALTRI